MLNALSLSGLEDLASGGESPRRSAILAALTNQYLDLEPRLSDRHIELYDNVFRLLVSGIELQARLALAEKLAPMKRAPRETVRALAHDAQAVVATPVLQRSPVLDENDLLSVARSRGEGHRAALAARPEIGARVTDVLLEANEQAVTVALVCNGSAKLSKDGAATLADIARSNMVVAQALAARLRMPAMAVTQLVDAARAMVINTLAQDNPTTCAGELLDAVGTAVDVVGSVPAEPTDRLNDQQIVTLYVMKSLDEVEAALAARAALSADIVGEAMSAARIDALLIVLKAARFAPIHVEGMLSARLGVPVGSRMLRDPLDQYDRINAAEPERMINFVLQREQFRRAN